MQPEDAVTPADRVKAVFDEAADIASPDDRAAFLDRACAGDDELRRRLDRLLRRHENSGSFLTRPAVGVCPDSFADRCSVAEGPGTVIGPYKLLEKIGEGAFGVVFLAEQTQPVRRKVALKVLKPGMDTRQVVARFEAERQALALMDHPNIARVFDGGATASGRPYFVMELVKGVPVTEFCDQNRLAPRQRLELFLAVCRAVQHAHQKGLIHRDLKPSNVLVSRHDTTPVVKVIDFGVAKAVGQALTDKTLFTGVAQMIGTPLYMSPEQAGMSDLDVDTRSDIYSLGVLLYELLTGTTPFANERFKNAGYDEIRRIIREEEPPRPSTRLSTLGLAATTASASPGTELRKLSTVVCGDLDWIVMKALEKDRSRRYETASAFAADVQRYLADEPVQARPPSVLYRLRKLARRHRRAVVPASALAFAAVVAVTALAVSTAFVWRANRDLQRDAYFRDITLAHSELSRDNLGRAQEHLDQCPAELRQWEWYYLKRLCRIEPLVIRHGTEVNSVAFNPVEEVLASAGGDGSIRVWHSRTGKLIRTIENAHEGFVCSVAFHPHGRHLASIGKDGKVKVWEWSTGDEVFRDRCDAVHTVGTACAVAFRPPDGRQLAVGFNGSVVVWDWEAKRQLHTFAAGAKYPITVAFSRDGRRLAWGNWLGGVSVWDAEAGGEPLHIGPETGEARNPIAALAFDPAGGRLAAAKFSRRVDVWTLGTRSPPHSLPQRETVLGVAFSPDGRLLASTGEDKTVHIWDAATGRELLGLRGHAGTCTCLAFSPDGWRLASASKDETIRIWDATPLRPEEEEQEGPTFRHHRYEVWTLAVSPDGREVVSGGLGSIAQVWDPQPGQQTVPFPGQETVFSVVWRPDGRRIASAGAGGGLFTVKVWDPQTGREDFQLGHARQSDPEFFAVAFSRDGRYLVTGRGNGEVQVWDGQTGEQIGTLGSHKSAVRGVVFSPDGKRLASASADGIVNVWDATRLDKKDLERRQVPRPFPARVPVQCLNVAFSPDSRLLATAGDRNTVKVWDVESENLLDTLGGHSADIYADICAVAFSPDDRWIAAAGEDSTVRVWDRRTRELVRTFRGHRGLVSSLAFAFTPDHRWLITGSRDHTVKIWDMTPLDEEAGR
jgi:WD40 repeat protein/serine/threonine protein kinase